VLQIGHSVRVLVDDITVLHDGESTSQRIGPIPLGENGVHGLRLAFADLLGDQRCTRDQRGRYISDEFASSAGKLTISWPKHSARELKQAGPDLFYNSDLTIEFVRDPQTGFGIRTLNRAYPKHEV
jgi:hypothetical protein